MNILKLEGGRFARLLAAAEAAEIWGLDTSTIRKAISDGRLVDGNDCRKFGKQWVVTVEGMARLYGWDPWSSYIRDVRHGLR